MSFLRYPKYKDSGVEWLGEVPEHWEVMALRRCLLEHRQGYYSQSPYVDSGVKLLRITDLRDFGRIDFTQCPQVEDLPELETFLLRPSDFVFARTGGAGTFGLVETLNEPSAYASYLIRFRFAANARSPFLRNFFLSSGFREAVRQNIHGGVNQNIHAEDIKDQFLALPPVAEQTTIAEFLDRETAKIDELVAEQRRLMELLKEKRQAVISHAVTQGINPDAPMKPSGIEWLGDVPEHWEEYPLRALFSLKHGYAFDGNDFSDSGDYVLMTPGSFNERGGFRSKTTMKFFTGSEIPKGFVLDGGELLVAMTEQAPGLLGSALFVPNDAVYLHNQRLGLVQNLRRDKLCQKFLFHLFNSFRFRAEISVTSTGSKVKHTSPQRISSVKVMLPPTSEQQLIAAYIDQRIAIIDALETEAQRAIDLLQERRTALISAAVTGQIDVRNIH